MKHLPQLKTKVIPMLGFLVLASMTLYLLIQTLIQAALWHSFGGILLIIITLGVFIALYFEGKRVWFNEQDLIKSKRHFREFVSVVGGALFTYYLAHDIGVGIVVAASLAGVLAHVFFADFEAPFFAGAFVGMSSTGLLFNYSELILAAAISGLTFILATTVFRGFGGKMGTVALVGTFLAGSSLMRQFELRPLPAIDVIILVFIFSVLTTPLTHYLNIKRDHGPVMASAVIGLMAGILLPRFFAENGSFYAIVVICASFIGMTVKPVCSNFWQITLSGVIMAIVFVYATPLLNGAGGKLGAIAFIAVLSICGFRKLAEVIISESSRPS